MARPRRPVAASACLLAALAAGGTGRAQGLRTLHVDALSMRADATRVDVGATFHLAIHARVRERVPALDELVIPDVGTMHVLGDERRVTASKAGTDVVETLTLEPAEPGAFTFAPAYLDAVDARTHKPSRFSSNPVRVVVGVAGPSYWIRISPLLAVVRAVAIAIGILVALAAVILATALLLTVARRRREVGVVNPSPAAVAAPPPPQQPTPRDAVANALRAYRTSPAESALLGLRSALFVAAGSSPGATLRDALAATHDGSLRAALTAAEHAAFGPAALRDDASRQLVDATEAWLR
jgi:hypothetical protein